MAERLVEEFARLVKEYGTAEGSEKAEAWNLIADFAVENSLKICLALDRTFPAKKPAEGRAQDIGTGGWGVHHTGQDPKLDEIVARRFGSRHEKPCDDPDVLTCTSPPCQFANKCMRACPSPPSKEGE